MAYPQENTEKEKMAKLFQSAMQASPARFVPVRNSIHNNPERKISNQIPIEQETNVRRWLGNCQHSKNLTAEVTTRGEFYQSNFSERERRVLITESDFPETSSSNGNTSRSSTESGEIVEESTVRSELSTLTILNSRRDSQNSPKITSFTASSALHSTAIDQSVTQNSNFIDPNQTFLPKPNFIIKNVNHWIDANKTFDPYRTDKQISIVYRKDSGYSTKSENITSASKNNMDVNTHSNQKSEIQDPNKTFKPNFTHTMERNRGEEGRKDGNMTFASCLECSNNIAVNSEISTIDPNTTFKPKELITNESDNLSNGSSTFNSDDINITFVPKITDCCNMTLDEQLGIIHSPTTHKHDSEHIAPGKCADIKEPTHSIATGNVALNISRKPQMHIKEDVIESKNSIPILQQKIEIHNSKKRPNSEASDIDYYDSNRFVEQTAKKHKFLSSQTEADITLEYQLSCSQQKCASDIRESSKTENTNPINYNIDENLEEEITEKIAEIERKEKVEKWETVKSLIRVICSNDRFLPKSVKITSLQDVIEIIKENRIPILQIIHEEKNFIEKIGTLLENEFLPACDIVLVFLELCVDDEAIQHFPYEIKRHFFTVLQRLVRCNDTGIKIKAKSVFCYVNKHT